MTLKTLVIGLLLLPFIAHAQNPPASFSVVINYPLFIQYESATDLDARKILSHALTIKVPKHQQSQMISAVLNMETIDGTLRFSNKLRLVPAGHSQSADANGLFLNSQPVLLPMSAGAPQQEPDNSYRVQDYDLIIEPIGMTIPPGTYRFAITFTSSKS